MKKGNYYIFSGISIGVNKRKFTNKIARFIGYTPTEPRLATLFILDEKIEIDVALNFGIKEISLSREHLENLNFIENETNTSEIINNEFLGGMIGVVSWQYNNLEINKNSGVSYLNQLFALDEFKNLNQELKDEIASIKSDNKKSTWYKAAVIKVK